MASVNLREWDDTPSGYCSCCCTLKTVGIWVLVSRAPNNCFRREAHRIERSRRGLTEREPFKSVKSKRGEIFSPDGWHDLREDTAGQ